MSQNSRRSTIICRTADTRWSGPRPLRPEPSRSQLKRDPLDCVRSYMRLLVIHAGQRYRFLSIDSSTRDGSLVIIIRREGEGSITYQWGTRPEVQTPVQTELPPGRSKNKKITVHQSGRINFHEIGQNIYIEPLTAITKTACIYRYRIPKISHLTPFDSAPDAEDCDFDLSALADESHSFSLYVGPANVASNSHAVKLAYLSRYAFLIALDTETYIPPSNFLEHFVTLKPERGTVGSQVMSEDQALIAYHQALNETKELVIYGPNGAGVWQVVFAVPMRIAPKMTIEIDDPTLYVDEGDIERDLRVATAMVRFKVRNRAAKAVVQTPVAFRSISLDANL